MICWQFERNTKSKMRLKLKCSPLGLVVACWLSSLSWCSSGQPRLLQTHRHALHTSSSRRRWTARTRFLDGCNTSLLYIASTALNTYSRAILLPLSKASTRLGSTTSLEIHGLRLISAELHMDTGTRNSGPLCCVWSLNKSNLYLRLVYKQSHSESTQSSRSLRESWH